MAFKGSPFSQLFQTLTQEGELGPVHLQDDSSPDVLLKIHQIFTSEPFIEPTDEECRRVHLPEFDWTAFTSTWLSVSAKGIDVGQFLINDDIFQDEERRRKPFCEDEPPLSLLTMDHLTGVKMYPHLQHAAEPGLKDALKGRVLKLLEIWYSNSNSQLQWTSVNKTPVNKTHRLIRPVFPGHFIK